MGPLATHRLPAALSPYVDGCRAYEHDPVPWTVHHGLPSPSLTMVFAITSPLDVAWDRRVDSRRRQWANLTGLAPSPVLIRGDGPQRGIQLTVTPAGARALFGLPAAALADELVDLSDVAGADGLDLHERLTLARSWPDRFAALDSWLLERLRRHEHRGAAIPAEVARAWILLTGTRPARVQAVADEVGWSRRHLAARFAAEYGIGPKATARLSRFQASVRLLRRPKARPLADVAYACGYADQAHLTREWRELAGRPPSEWRSAELPFLQDAEAAR